MHSSPYVIYEFTFVHENCHIYIHSNFIRSVKKPNKSDLLAASEKVVISTVYCELQNALN